MPSPPQSARPDQSTNMSDSPTTAIEWSVRYGEWIAERHDTLEDAVWSAFHASNAGSAALDGIEHAGRFIPADSDEMRALLAECEREWYAKTVATSTERWEVQVEHPNRPGQWAPVDAASTEDDARIILQELYSLVGPGRTRIVQPTHR